ncbi:MAG: hypothetical protein V1900_00120 [Candidatus Aenigmatarchaeota archaeon]
MEDIMMWKVVSIAITLVVLLFSLAFLAGYIGKPIVAAPILLKRKGTIPYNPVVSIILGIIAGVVIFALWAVFSPSIVKFASEIVTSVLG